METPYVLGPFRLDAEAGILFRGSEPLSLGRRAVAVLRALVERPGAPVSKNALMEAAWVGLSVEESNLAVQIAALRRVFSTEPDGERWIETLPGRGYRFVGPAAVREESGDTVQSLGDAKAPPFPSGREKSVPPRFSIVVLPFVNISGDPEQEHFVDGVTESLTTDLSGIAGAFVVARNTAFTLKGKSFDAAAIGRELNVRYVLEGSIQRVEDRLRVNVQLIDVETGGHLWADRFDKPAANYLDIQDEIVARLAGPLGAELIAAEARRAESAPNPDAFDLHLQGSAWLNKGPSRSNLARARDFFHRALAMEPDNIEALAGCAWADIWDAAYFASPERPTRLAAAEAALSKALAEAPGHAKAHLALSYVKINSNRPAQGLTEAERALALDRNLAEALVAVGYAKLHLGHAEEMEEYVERAFRLSPRDPFAFLWMAFAGEAKLHLGAYEDAAKWLSRSAMANSNFPGSHFLLAAALGQLGRVEEARTAAEAGLALMPEFTVSHYQAGANSNNPTFLAQRGNIYDGLRKAGAPEGDRAALPAPDPPRAAAVAYLVLPKKPSIAVLAFENMSGDPSQDYFADGIVEDITTELSRFKELLVIARNSSFAYKGRAVDVRQIGRELGVRYVLEGSVRKAAARVRITGQLIDASSGAHLWADRFDGDLEDVFNLQDRITTSVVASIGPKLEQAEIERARGKPTESLDAYDYYLRGMAAFGQRTNEANSSAQRLFKKAIELDPEFATAHAMAAWCTVWRRLNGWMVDRAQESAEAVRLARRAVELGDDDPVALARGGHTLGVLLDDLETAVTLIDRALALNPNSAFAWALGGWMRACLGEPEAAMEWHARAMRLSPLDPDLSQMQCGMGFALLMLGRYDDASAWGEKAYRGALNFLAAAALAAGSHALAGRAEESRPAMERVRLIDPSLRISNLKDWFPLRRAQDAAIMAQAMRKAGLPE